MDAAIILSSNPPANRGLDYSYLRAEGVALLQQLSGSIWTDYNEHDPGVTTLEQLCYALTELGYRAEFPVADLLTNQVSGRVDINRHGLYSARQILPCDAVTVDDYRKLLVDRVPGVRNAWLAKYDPATDSPPDYRSEFKGLYDIHIYAPGHHTGNAAGEGDGTDDSELRRQIRWTYNQSRNLCEDLQSVVVLIPMFSSVHADVDIETSNNADQVMAQILFQLGMLLAPELRRQSLGNCVNSGDSPSEIFNGPLLENGFVSADQLQPQPIQLPVNEVISTVASVPGVLAVRNLFVKAGDHTYEPEETIPTPQGRFLRLDTRFLTGLAEFPIRLFFNGIACKVTPGLVEMELSLLRSAAERSYPLDAQYDEYFGLPISERRDLLGYYSIQNQYPNTYGISSYGLPLYSTIPRMAQAKQLKGYLLVFEQLLADYFAQVANVKELFCVDPDSRQTYFWQTLAYSVPEVQPILKDDYLEGLQNLVALDDPSAQRRSAFLEYLLSLYACELTAMTDNGSSNDAQQLRLIRARRQFLAVLAQSTGSRGRSFDVLERPSSSNFAGMQYKCLIQMGLDLAGRRSLTECLEASEVDLRKTEQILFGSRVEDRKSKGMEDAFRSISTFPKPSVSKAGTTLLRGMSLTEELLSNLRDPNNLYVGSFPDDKSVHLVYRDPACGDWIIIALFIDLIEALIEAYALILLIEALIECTNQLYIVEHILLRPRGPLAPVVDGFAYNFTLTAVVALPWAERINPDNRETIQAIILENTPAHIAAGVCILGPYELLEFEVLYFLWREALLTHLPLAIDEASAVLINFLQSHPPLSPSPIS